MCSLMRKLAVTAAASREIADVLGFGCVRWPLSGPPPAGTN